jgi:DNA-binding IclR family transcriptional regulator
MLADLPDFEIEQTVQKVASRLADVPGQDLASIMQAVTLCRQHGYALGPDEPLGRIMGLAVTITNRLGRPQGTLSINGIPERFAVERLPELLEALRAQAKAIQQAMGRIPDSERHRARWAAGATR